MDEDEDDVLTPREELVMQLRYGAGWSLARIARGIGVAPAGVCRSHESALRHLVVAAGGVAFDDDPEDLPTASIPRQPVEWIPAREAWSESAR